MRELEMEGKNVEEAITKGLSQLQIEREAVEVKILDEGSSGLFGLMGAKPARVYIREKVEKDKTDISPSLNGKINLVEKFLSGLLARMDLEDVSLQSHQENDQLIINLETNNRGLLIGKGGMTLEALQLITNRAMQQRGDFSTRIILDSYHYRQRQEENMRELVTQAVTDVRAKKIPFVTDQLSTSERRLVYSFLKDAPDIEFFSEGKGSYKTITMRLRSGN